MKPKDTVIVTIRMSPRMRWKLRAKALRLHTTVQAVGQMALADWLANNEKERRRPADG